MRVEGCAVFAALGAPIGGAAVYALHEQRQLTKGRFRDECVRHGDGTERFEVRMASSVADNSDFVVGRSVCHFSALPNQPASHPNGRDCDGDIAAFPVSHTVNGTVVSVTVRMDIDTTQGGDSGEDWSYSSKAYGSHIGDHIGTSTNVWTPAIYFEGSNGLNCYDNAPAESFFASLKKECTHLQTFTTRTEAYDAIAAYIDGFYNSVRRHSALGYLSPTRYEQLDEVKLAA